ncbi:SAM hydrolase/SAM-dependent halogenase family protein [Flindersiella endophytica]
MIAFLTDYGTRDAFAAVCHGVIARIAPEERVLDLTHDVPAHDIRHGARVLARAAEYLPPCTYVAVVDPGVGTSRRGIALLAGESVLVGPDNGLLLPAAHELGGVREARQLTNQRLWLEKVDRTFHGRDIFAPVAAHLSTGVDFAEAGPVVYAGSLVRLPEPRWSFDEGGLTAEVTYVDGFGNVQLAPGGEQLPRIAERTDAVEIRHGVTVLGRARVGAAFGDVERGELVLYVDADGRVAIAVNSGNAARTLGGVTTGTMLELVPVSG